MDKDDLVASIAQKMGVSIAEATRILDKLLAVISKALERGESFDLSGFGKFAVKTRAARSSRDPRTGQTIQIPGDRVPVFSPDKALMDLVDEVQSVPAAVNKPKKRATRGINPPEAPPKPRKDMLGRGSGAPAVPRMEESAAKPPAPASEPEDAAGRDDPLEFTLADAPIEEESSPPATETDERRVNAHILFAGKKRKTFVRGAENTVRCWIGLPEKGVPTSNEDIQTNMPIPKDGLELTVQILWRTESDSGKIILPANKTARSGDCDLHLQVPDNARYISAELSFRYRGSVFEMIRLETDVLSADEQEQDHHELLLQVEMQHREAIEIEDRQEVDSTFIFGEDRSKLDAADGTAPSTLRKFGRGDPDSFDLSDANEAINFLNKELFITEAELANKAVSTTTHNDGNGLDGKDEDVIRIMRQMAAHGAVLYNKLNRQHFDDPGERIQLVNTERSGNVPIEFVYDRGHPARDATICMDGIKALNSDAEDCPKCKPAKELKPEDRHKPKIICPFGFWSIKKIIERKDPPARSSAIEGSQSVPRTDRRNLSVIDRALFASSDRVPEDERIKTAEALAEHFVNPGVAQNWSDWRKMVKDNQPPLLLVLPHHHIEDKLDYLEIGAKDLAFDERLLSRGEMDDSYVNPNALDPGPIVILLGCRTATESETGYVQLARTFQELSTSIVVGTLAKILGRYAAPLARELVAELVSVDDDVTDFGTIMRRVRRRMLGKGYLIALSLVALGDAEWRLTPRNDSIS